MSDVQQFCHVHIGAPKTGSTFLQRAFCENRAALLRRGLIYPAASLRGFGHHDIAFLLSGSYPEWATGQDRPLDALAADLTAEIAGHAGSVLLSSENFYLFPAPERLKDFLATTGASAGRRTRIVVYLRRQDEAHESWYNQRVKAQGETGTAAESVARFHDLWDYESRLGRWSDAFGQDALVVRRYRGPAAGGGDSLLADVLRVLALGDFAPDIPEQPVNVAENRDVLEFQRQMNFLPLSPQEKRRFHKQLMALSERSKGLGLFDERPLLNASERQAIMARYADANRAVAERYFPGETLFADAQGEPAFDGPSPPVEPGLTQAKMLYILGWLLAYKE